MGNTEKIAPVVTVGMEYQTQNETFRESALYRSMFMKELSSAKYLYEPDTNSVSDSLIIAPSDILSLLFSRKTT